MGCLLLNCKLVHKRAPGLGRAFAMHWRYSRYNPLWSFLRCSG